MLVNFINILCVLAVLALIVFVYIKHLDSVVEDRLYEGYTYFKAVIDDFKLVAALILVIIAGVMIIRGVVVILDFFFDFISKVK